MNGFAVLDGVAAQSPLTPELIAEVRQLDELRFVMLLLAFALVIMLALVYALFKMIAQYGKQVDISAKNSDRLAVNTDALQDMAAEQKAQTSVLQQMATDNTRKLTLIEQGNADAKAARAAAETVATAIDDSGLRTLPDLIKEHMSAQAPVLERATAALEHVASALTELRTSDAARDDRLGEVLSQVMSELGNVRGVLERVALPVAVVVPAPAETPKPDDTPRPDAPADDANEDEPPVEGQSDG